MNRPAAIYHMIILILLLIGCGPGVEEGPILRLSESAVTDSDTRDTTMEESDSQPPIDSAVANTDTNKTTDADTIAPLGMETDTSDSETYSTDLFIHPQCAQNDFEATTITDIASIHDDSAHFVSAGKDCLLSVGANGTEIRITFIDPEVEDLILGFIDFPKTSESEPIGIACYADRKTPEYHAFVVVGDDSISEIYEGRMYAQSVERIFHEQVELNGIDVLSKTTNGDYHRICAYGDGIFCTETQSDHLTFETIREQTGVSRYNDLDIAPCFDSWCEVAVGENGLIEIHTENGWQIIESGTHAALNAVTAFENDFFTAAGDSGVLLTGSVETVSSPSTLFLSNAENIISVRRYDDRLYGATSEGHLFTASYHNDALEICPNSDRIDGPILAFMLAFCESSRNYVVLNNNAFIGQYNCNSIAVVK